MGRMSKGGSIERLAHSMGEWKRQMPENGREKRRISHSQQTPKQRLLLKKRDSESPLEKRVLVTGI